MRLAEVFAREVLTFLEPEGKVGYRWGRDGVEQETMDHLEFIARVTSHIPDYAVVDRIIDHLKLTFMAAKPPPSRVFTEVALAVKFANLYIPISTLNGVDNI